MPALVLALVVLVLLVALSGCGGDTATARQYLEDGKKIHGPNSDWVPLADLFTEVIKTINEAARSGTPLNAEQLQKVDQLIGMTNEFSQRHKDEISEYQKIKKMADVQGYKELADLYIENVELALQAMKDTITLLEYCRGVMGAPGYDTQEVFKRVNALDEESKQHGPQRERILQKIDELEDKLGI